MVVDQIFLQPTLVCGIVLGIYFVPTVVYIPILYGDRQLTVVSLVKSLLT